MKIYHGLRTSYGEAYVTVREDDGKPKPLVHQARHSPTGFEWGYGGSGPADLALSILWDLLGESLANRLYQDFKFAFIATAERDRFEISEADIRMWLGPVLKDLRDRFKGNS